MEIYGMEVPKEWYSQPIYMNARSVAVTGAFKPKGNLSMAQIEQVRSIWERDKLEREYANSGMFELKICKLHSNARPIQFRLSVLSVLGLLQDIERIENGTRLPKEDICWCFQLINQNDHAATSAEEDNATTDGSGVEQLVLLKECAENRPDAMAGSIATGKQLYLHFRPNLPNGEAAKKPWTWEFMQYQCKRGKDHTVATMNERTLSIPMSTEEIKSLLWALRTDFTLWESLQRTAAFLNAYSDKIQLST